MEKSVGRLERAKQRLTQAQARYEKVSSVESQKARKEDLRRKIIVGGAVLAMVDSDDRAASLLNVVIDGLKSDRDKALFNVSAT
ncbi:mobilization protein [Gluconacetobacter sp. 1b LMG 1731]|uniref:Mobilization protein n=1 Tax=Gluconacetobacter dulcium TaxID=2729096 RepID=A0A7W4NRF3_9PROT|nr:mobilization protein [Gluconacetobacter dulcium]MBB2163407.1 mobilization protein [Gluconacetobacter dulcium]MBB2192476.1 mobilization protein [Gluconacetobacter dulcium]